MDCFLHQSIIPASDDATLTHDQLMPKQLAEKLRLARNLHDMWSAVSFLQYTLGHINSLYPLCAVIYRHYGILLVKGNKMVNLIAICHIIHSALGGLGCLLTACACQSYSTFSLVASHAVEIVILCTIAIMLTYIMYLKIYVVKCAIEEHYL